MNSQIEKAAENADLLHRKVYPEQYKNDPAPPVTPPVTPAVPPVTPDPNAPPPIVDPNAPAPVAPPAPPAEPAAPPATPPAPTVDPNAPAPVIVDDPAALKKELEVQAQKFKVLQGKYDAEVPRTIKENRELQELLRQSIATINQINAARVAQTPGNAPGTPPAHDSDSAVISLDNIPGAKALKEDYPDIFDTLDGMVKNINDQTAKLAGSIKTVQTEQQSSVGTVFKSDLGRLVPDWQTIKEDPDFSLWLTNTEPFTGRPLFELAMEAADNMDANRLAGFYDGYKKLKGITPSPPADPSPTPAVPTPATTAPVVPANIAPPRSANAQAPSVDLDSNKEPKITQSFIKNFYQRAVKGDYRGKDDEFNKIEAQIHAATKARKVLPG